jgi:hypothetical protein
MIQKENYLQIKRMALISMTVLMLSSFVVTGQFASAQSAINNCTKVGITAFKASPNDAGNVPANTIDNNINTRWSSFGIGSFIQTDLGLVQTICSVDIGWYNGDTRQNNFAISVSADGTTFTDVFTGKSSGTITQIENYDFQDIDARYVKITVNGNTQNNWASITEIAVNGFGGTSPPPPPPPDACQKLPTGNAVANGDDGNLPANAIDNNLNTRWSNLGIGSWIQTDLGEQKTICSVNIAWYLGNVRQNNFVISISNDGSTFTDIFTGKSSGITLSPESYNLPSNTFGRFVRITVNGNTQNNWASITEIAVNGFGGTSPPPPTNHAPVVDNINDVPVQITNPPTPVSITLVGRDADNDPLTFEVVQTPTKGTVTSTGPNTVKYSLDPSVQSDTTDSFTYRANDRKEGGVSNIGTVTLKITSQQVPPPQTGVDKFGIKELYPTKAGGEQWFMNMQDPTGDKQTNPPSMSKNPGGSFKVTSTQVRYPVFTSSGYHPDQIKTTDQKIMAQQGYMQSPNDWKNVEITGYLKVNSFTGSSNNGPAHIEFMARGGVHTSSKSCEGTAYHSNLYETGRSKFEKELQHTAGYTTNDPGKSGATSKLDGRWVGIKAVFYTKPDGTVKLEQWLDDGSDNINAPGNNWHKLLEFTDSGSWGGGHPNCGGTPSTKITWGGPMVHFRWDNIDNMDIKNFSVREIQPTTTATTKTSMVDTSNAHTEFSPPSVIAVNPYY